MNNPTFAPGTAKADLFTLDTREGRARMFKERIDELMRTKGLKTLDDAIYEMRTGGNKDDIALLAAMGEQFSQPLVDRLKADKQEAHFQHLRETAQTAKKDSPEMKAAIKVVHETAKAANARKIAVNIRIDDLLAKGFSMGSGDSADASQSKRRGATCCDGSGVIPQFFQFYTLPPYQDKGHTKRKIDYGDYRSIIQLDFDGKRRAWLLTGFDKK